MSKRGRKPQAGHRTANGRLSQRQAARPDRDDGLVAEQPHRRHFGPLLGENAARSQLAATALGRLRLIGQAEEELGLEPVRKKLFPQRLRGVRYGIDEVEYMAALEYATAVGRERWVRAAPKDKPSAVAFMVARGIDLSGRDLSDAETLRYVADFEESRAALLAAPCPEDMRRVLRTLRSRAAERGDGHELRLLRGIGPLANPANSGAIKQAVDLIVIDDRDPAADTLKLARRGFAALADMHYGTTEARQRRTRSWAQPAEESQGGWKGRHRSLADSA